MVSWTDDKKVVVVYHDDKVKAVIVHDGYASALTGRGIRLGDDVNAIQTKYDRAGAEAYLPSGPAGQGREIRRYDGPGVGFEIVNGRVVGMTLYPPAK